MLLACRASLTVMDGTGISYRTGLCAVGCGAADREMRRENREVRWKVNHDLKVTFPHGLKLML